MFCLEGCALLYCSGICANALFTYVSVSFLLPGVYMFGLTYPRLACRVCLVLMCACEFFESLMTCVLELSFLVMPCQQMRFLFVLSMYIGVVFSCLVVGATEVFCLGMYICTCLSCPVLQCACLIIPHNEVFGVY